MKFRWEKKYLYWGITAFLVIVCSISFFLLLNRFDEFMNGMRFLANLLMPFVIGLVLAYLLSPIMEFFEGKCFLPLFAYCRREREKRRAPERASAALKPQKRRRVQKAGRESRLPRVLAIIVTFILAAALVCGLIGMVVPKLIDTIYGIVQSMPGYLIRMQQWAVQLSASYPEVGAFLEEQFVNLGGTVSTWLKTNLLPQMNNLVSTLTSGVMGFFSTIMDIFVGLIVAIYVLFSKEKFLAQTKKVTYALFPVRGANVLLKITRRADGMFGGFIKGKLIDSSIIGVLCFLGLSFLPFLQNPYALLIAVMIGVTNIVPFFGPFIGAIPSAILLLMVDPWKCLWFIVFIIVLQQLDGNVIGPRILGGSTGLSAFWVIFSIMVFGGLFGFVGMVIGVPAFALIYSLITEYVEVRLHKKELPVDTGAYMKIDHIDGALHEPVYQGGGPPDSRPDHGIRADGKEGAEE